MKEKTRKYLLPLFILWGMLMLILLFGMGRNRSIYGLPYEEQLKLNINIHPGITINRYLKILEFNDRPYLIRHAFVNLAGNIVMFIPMGIFFPAFAKPMKNIFGFLFFSALMIFTVETVQLFTLRGSFDVDDIILNLIGALLGFILNKISLVLFSKKHRA